LAIAGAPDDVLELTCGGTLLKRAQARITKTEILDLTGGEMGTTGVHRRPRQRSR